MRSEVTNEDPECYLILGNRFSIPCTADEAAFQEFKQPYPPVKLEKLRSTQIHKDLRPWPSHTDRLRNILSTSKW
uniref:Uncharacterized protein n=1 Tax=Physcomitrium patens TaxID=3218 RepID=A0A2K1J2N6_PHYPA|nr:hypothetical protein PHYPA_021639 [Physcomitrium patens]